MGKEMEGENFGSPIGENPVPDTPEGDGEDLQAVETGEAEKLHRDLEAKDRENKSLQDKYLRTYADFENYKKRAAKDQEELSKYGNEKLLKDFLPVLDNLERAIFHTKELQQYEKILECLQWILSNSGMYSENTASGRSKVTCSRLIPRSMRPWASWSQANTRPER